MVKKILCIVQARMNSKRLPGKILKNLNSKYTVLDFLLHRLKQSKKVHETIVACTKNPRDNKIIELIKKLNINFFRGSENNVLERFYQAAKKYNADIVVRITSDCPLVDPKLVDKFLLNFLKSNYDYYSNILPRTFPDGLDVEIFSFKTLENARKNCYSKFDLEHVTPFMLRSKKLKKGNFNLRNDLSTIRITLDTHKDLIFLRRIVKKFNPKKYFSWKRVLSEMNIKI
jgi:spore coat polysaccharide biosynthesis protein SpsF (cytidylyltransferase family)